MELLAYCRLVDHCLDGMRNPTRHKEIDEIQKIIRGYINDIQEHPNEQTYMAVTQGMKELEERVDKLVSYKP